MYTVVISVLKDVYDTGVSSEPIMENSDAIVWSLNIITLIIVDATYTCIWLYDKYYVSNAILKE